MVKRKRRSSLVGASGKASPLWLVELMLQTIFLISVHRVLKKV